MLWVKEGIPPGFRVGVLQALPSEGLSFVDRDTFPIRRFVPEDGVRIVPGGSSIRAGAYVARGVICVPPMYVNTGAVCRRGNTGGSARAGGQLRADLASACTLRAAAQIGGVLEPVNASPVIIEDDVLVGGNTGVYEGTIMRKGAVLAAGTILTRGTPVFDLVHGTVLRASSEMPLIIPENAVVVPGSRAVTKGKGHANAEAWGLSVYAPVIVKYRDEKTDLSTTLEDLLR